MAMSAADLVSLKELVAAQHEGHDRERAEANADMARADTAINPRNAAAANTLRARSIGSCA
jgi:hypothetical protein